MRICFMLVRTADSEIWEDKTNIHIQIVGQREQRSLSGLQPTGRKADGLHFLFFFSFSVAYFNLQPLKVIIMKIFSQKTLCGQVCRI